MIKKLTFLTLLIASIAAMAETALIIKPVSGQEQATLLSQIGKLKLTDDSLFVYSHSNVLLSKNALTEVGHIRFGEGGDIMGIDDVTPTLCRVYPNPTHDLLMIDNADAEHAHLFNLNGQLIETISLLDGKASVNITNLSEGEYLLLINSKVYKVLKQ